MIAASQFGLPLMVLFVVLQWWSREERLHMRYVAICSGIAFILGLAINQGILLFIHRLRPYDAGVSHLLIARSTDWSFPSDHATASMAVAASFFIHKISGRGLFLFAVALLICISRVYVGTHYFTDVLGGTAIGTLAAIVAHFLFRKDSKLNRIATGLF